MTFDILIKNGTVLDGIGIDGRAADIGITGKEVRAVGNLERASAKLVIWAQDKYVTPGFIDIQNHSDSYLTLLEIPTQESLVTQGITTIAVGHCGTSLAPLASPEAFRSVQKWHSLAGVNLNWLTFAEYLDTLGNYPLGVNILSLVGHSTLRRGLLGDEARSATAEEIKITVKLLAESLEIGSGGLSLGLIYAHEVDAAAEEFAAGAKLVASKNKLISVHLRSEGAHVAGAVDEVIGLSQKSGSRLKISHFKVRGRQNWPLLEQALAAIDRAYQKGIDIFFDVYPYTTSWTVLYTFLPKWAYEGGRAAILRNLSNPPTRQKILAYLKSQEQNFGKIFIATSETNPAFLGKTLAQIAANQEISVEEALLNVIAGTQAQVIVFDENLSEDVLHILLRHPLSVVGSDGAGYDFNFSLSHGLVHPRCFGTMPKFLSLVRDKKLMSWAEAIKKITSKPAEKLGLKGRGKITSGAVADLVIFDPREIGSQASYENPYQQALGIDWVMVNGKVAFSKTEPLKRESAGEVLRV